MLLTTPDTIRTLQRKLYIKAKQETAYVLRSIAERISVTSSVALEHIGQQMCMPWREEHRKAVCGKIACTV
jgi:hypothetical protein